MPEDPSIVRKTETALDDLADLWRRRRGVCLLVVIVIGVPIVFSLYLKFIKVPALEASKAQYSEDLAMAKAERDKAQLQLAPFLAAANQAYPNQPVDERLELLVTRLAASVQIIEEAASRLTTDRDLGQIAMDVMVRDLSALPPLNVDVISVLTDPDSYALAAQIREVFQRAGWPVAGAKGSIFKKPIKGIRVYFSALPSEEVRRALVPLYDTLGYPREASIDSALPPDTLKIIVGSK